MRKLLVGIMLMANLVAAAGLPKAQGHRGARATRPENTIPAFEYAISAGVDTLELDMAVTKDNVLVISHDLYLQTPTCSGPKDKAAVRELTLAEVRQWDCGALKNPQFPKQETVAGTRMPTLDEVFALAPKGKFDFNIETKISPDHPELSPTPEAFVQLVLASIRKHKLEARVIVQSFDFRTLRAMHAIAPEIRLAALFSSAQKPWPELAKDAQAAIVSPVYQLVTKEQVEAAHKAGLQVIPWTPNTPADWDRLIDANVDAIITDDPAALVNHLRKVSAKLD